MEKDFSRREPEKPIDRIYVEDQVRDRSYIVPTNHYHPYYEIYYLESGSCRFFIGGTMLDVHAGDLLIIPPGPCTTPAISLEPAGVSISFPKKRPRAGYPQHVPGTGRVFQSVASSADPGLLPGFADCALWTDAQ